MPEHGTWVGRTIRFARMAGTSTAAPDAAPWVTDFLNAAYYARPPAERSVDDLRLAFTILTTRWWRKGPRRLHVTDLPRFHRAFGRQRIGARGGFGRLTREDLLAGAERMLGTAFVEGHGDPARTGWGIVFATPAERASYIPEARLRSARLGPMTPPIAPPADLVWQSYTPVPVPDVALTLSRIAAPERWPDSGSDHGRFTPLRTGGLPGQTFEIEVVAGAGTRHPVITRGYVTATRVSDGGDPEALAAAVARLEAGLADVGGAVPAGQSPVAVVELTTHEGHFIGPAISHLLLTTGPEGGTLRDVGVWEPMAFPQRTAYRLGGRAAQHAFWGEAAESGSMLHQFAAPAGAGD
jgi:hypothetical protein